MAELVRVHPTVWVAAIAIAIMVSGAAVSLFQRMASLQTQVEELRRLNLQLTHELVAAREEIRQVRRELAAAQTAMQATQCLYPEQLRKLGRCPGGVDPTGVRSLLVAVGPDPALWADLAALRGVASRTGMRFRRLLHATMTSFKRELDQARARGQAWRNVHLALHMGPAGVEFADGVADGVWLSEQLAGVQVLVLAGCEGTLVADMLRVVPFVVSMAEEISHEDAAIFAETFWAAIGEGQSPSDAFYVALQRCPSAVAEFAELHM